MALSLKRSLTLCAILALHLPHIAFAHPQGRSKPSFIDDDGSTSLGDDAMGAGWGKGCSYVCEGNFDDIIETWDHFSTWIYSALNASFIDTKSELTDIIDDASTMLLTKVHQKAAAISHHQARLEATHRVLVDLIGEDDIQTTTERQQLATSEPTDVHIGTGVMWSTFGLQMLVAVTVGIVIESIRIRKQHSVQQAFGLDWTKR